MKRTALFLLSLMTALAFSTGCRDKSPAPAEPDSENSAIADSAAAAAPETAARGYVLIQAEQATTVTAPMRLVNFQSGGDRPGGVLDGAANDTYLEIPQGAGKPPEVNGSAVLPFAIAAEGAYFLWLRVWWDDGCGNSLGMSIDNGREFVLGQDATYRQWHWIQCKVRLAELNLTPGQHSLKLSNREDGIAVDQILFTRNKRLVPVGVMD